MSWSTQEEESRIRRAEKGKKGGGDDGTERSTSELIAWAEGRMNPTAFTIHRPSYAAEYDPSTAFPPQWIFHQLQLHYAWPSEQPGSPPQLMPVVHVPAGGLIELRTEPHANAGPLFNARASMALMQMLTGALPAHDGVAACFATCVAGDANPLITSTLV